MRKTKKQLATLGLAVMLASNMSMTAFAGQWQQDTTGWWYQNDDGSYFINGWNWIDGKCYYFTPEGYCLTNTTTPDGYMVDGSGAWIVNGIVQTQNGEAAQADISSGYNSYGISNAAIDMLDSTKEENAAKYGAIDEYERSGDLYVKYENGLTVSYWKGNPSDVLTNTPSDILKGIDNNIQKSAEAEANLKSNGYADTYSNEVNAISNVNGYQITWTVGIPLMRITKIKYYN